jgi:uroporphyrinogen-III decarboxylase
MTSRQRILAALNHRPVDRVPIDLGGTRQSGISAFAYARLRKLLMPDSAGPFRIFDLYQMLAEIEHEIAKRFGADCVLLNRRAVAFSVPNDSYKPFTLRDGTETLIPAGFNPEKDGEDLVLRAGDEIIARMPANGFYFDRYGLYPGATHPDLKGWEPPRLSKADLEHFETASKALADSTDKAVVAAMGPPYELFNGIGQGGFEDWMITFATEDDYVSELYRKLVDAWIDNLIAFRKAVGDRVQVIQIADDFGTQNAPYLSVDMFREKVMPAYKRGLDWIHQNTDWKVLLHSDGAIVPLIDSIIEMGVDALNPIQTNAAGMKPAGLKEQFGGRIVFWGAGCDPHGVIAHGTPQQVRQEVHENLRVFDPLKGGFVFASIHNVQADVPAENIAAMYDAAMSFSQVH